MATQDKKEAKKQAMVNAFFFAWLPNCSGKEVMRASTTPAGAPRAVTRFLTIAEKLDFSHDRHLGMRCAHMRHIGVVVRQTDHQFGGLPEILSKLG